MARSRSWHAWEAILVAFVGILLAGGIAVARVRAESTAPATPFVELMRDASSGIERWVAAGDGQAHAVIAADPTMGSEELMGWGPTEYAYRGQRPLMGWVAWLLPGSPATAIVIAFVLAGGLLALAWWRNVPLRLVLPATLLVLVLCSRSPVVEPLGVALMLLGIAWYRDQRSWAAAACFGLAALCRETLLLVPAALTLHEMSEGRPRDGVRLACSALPFAAWLVVLHDRTGAWPWMPGSGRLSFPLRGLIRAWGDWEIIETLLVGILVLAAWVCWQARGWARWIGVAHVLLLVTLGENVWAMAFDFGRVLLPIVVLAAVVVDPTPQPRSP